MKIVKVSSLLKIQWCTRRHPKKESLNKKCFISRWRCAQPQNTREHNLKAHGNSASDVQCHTVKICTLQSTTIKINPYSSVSLLASLPFFNMHTISLVKSLKQMTTELTIHESTRQQSSLGNTLYTCNKLRSPRG